MSALTELLALFNSANGTSYTTSQVRFGNPTVASAPDASHNTEIVMYGESSGGYTGSVNLKYKRLSLATQFDGVTLESTGPETGGTLAEVLADIKNHTGVEIFEEDLTNDPSVDFSSGSLILTAHSTSLKWTGTVTVTLHTELRDISGASTTTLPGFEYATIAQ